MCRLLAALVLCLALTPALAAEINAPDADAPPAWAYPVNPPDFKPAVDDGSLRHVPRSTQAYTLSQLRDFFMAPDWHPDDHPVMPGSVARGRALVAAGGGRTVPCAGCHGPNLQGLGAIPPLAGRSPTYLVRQLYDFKHGARASSGSVLMQPTVERLEIEDMISIAAYAASVPP